MLDNIGDVLRRLRRDRDLTQQQLARTSGVSQQTVSAIERGLRPTPEQLRRLVRVLGVSQATVATMPVDVGMPLSTAMASPSEGHA